MALQIQAKEAKNGNAVLLAMAKERPQPELIRQFSALSYDPEIPLGPKEVTQFFHPQKNIRVFALGLGEEKDSTKSHLYFRSLLVQQRTKLALRINVPTEHLTEGELTNAVIGLRMGLLNYGTYRTNGTKFTEPEVTIIVDKKRQPIAQNALVIAEAQIRSMDLVDLPSNIKTPAFIAQKAVQTGKDAGFSVDVFDTAKLKKMGMHALLAVGQGSANPPVMIVLEYKPKGHKSKKADLGLVGKGVSFDTGGISIKPSTNMAYMKSDMAGAAAVIGAVETAARLQLPLHVVGIIPAAENSVDANSIRPGDVISSYSGKSIEVIDTDAEGRLILADGLAYLIKHFQPAQVIDLATLTGSCIATLGNTAAGMFTNNDAMASALTVAGDRVNERVWRLPLWEEYMPEMHSEIADIKNLSTRPMAGAITAAKFLEFFTENHQSWAHLDIAGVAFTDSEYAKTRTATAYGVRLLLSYMQQLKK
jgi:leucyl aminopeptidase